MFTTNTNSIKRMRKRSKLDLQCEQYPCIKRTKLSCDDKETLAASTSSTIATSSNSEQEQTELYPDYQQYPMMNVSSAYWSVYKIKIVHDKIASIKYRESGNHQFEVNIFTISNKKPFKINGYINSLDHILYDENLNTIIIAYDTSYIELYRYNNNKFKKFTFGVHKYDKDLISVILNKQSLVLFTKRSRMYHTNINKSVFDNPCHGTTRYLPCMYISFLFLLLSLYFVQRMVVIL